MEQRHIVKAKVFANGSRPPVDVAVEIAGAFGTLSIQTLLGAEIIEVLAIPDTTLQ